MRERERERHRERERERERERVCVCLCELTAVHLTRVKDNAMAELVLAEWMAALTHSDPAVRFFMVVL